MAANVRLRVLRGIIKELKLLYGSKGPARNIFGYSFLISEYRKSMSVDEQLAESLNINAMNYLCMLNSERKKQELEKYYKGAGESKIETIARRVGFDMPSTSSTNSSNMT